MITRRRYMGGIKEGYIKDGLIFWLDGIDKGNDPTSWTDLMYGAKFPYNDTVILNEDNVDFSLNTRVLNASPDYPAPLTPLRSSTIEVVCQYTNASKLIYYSPSKLIYYSPSNLAFGILGSCILPNGHTFYVRDNTPNKIFTFTCISDIQAFQNGQSLEKGNVDNWYGNASYAQLGGRQNTNTLFKEKLYCIRIYNRLLNEDEVQHNFEIDKKRFNI